MSTLQLTMIFGSDLRYAAGDRLGAIENVSRARSAICRDSDAFIGILPERGAKLGTSVHPGLINSRFAYDSVSRASLDAEIYTNNTTSLAESLSRHVSKASALDFGKNEENFSATKLRNTKVAAP